MFWCDLKLLQSFKMKHEIWQNLCTFKKSYIFKSDGEYKYDILGQL